jgi:hypothetical protein
MTIEPPLRGFEAAVVEVPPAFVCADDDPQAPSSKARQPATRQAVVAARVRLMFRSPLDGRPGEASALDHSL